MWTMPVRLGGKSALRRGLSDTAAMKKLSLSFAAPHTSLYFKEGVESVTLPGASGEYGVTVGHSRLVEELKPGVVKVVRAAGEPVEKYFVSGGFAFTDAEQTEVSVAEAVNLEDLDIEKIKATHAKAKATLDSAADDDLKATATVELETTKTMASALGIQL